LGLEGLFPHGLVIINGKNGEEKVKGKEMLPFKVRKE